MNPAKVADLEARWQPLTDEQRTNAQAFLDDAWALILSRRPLLDSYLTDGLVSTQAAVAVVCAVVLRILRNPEGFIDESIDDWRGRRSELLASGVLTVTDQELSYLSPVGGHAGAFSVSTYGEPDTAQPLNAWELNL